MLPTPSTFQPLNKIITVILKEFIQGIQGPVQILQSRPTPELQESQGQNLPCICNGST